MLFPRKITEFPLRPYQDVATAIMFDIIQDYGYVYLNAYMRTGKTLMTLRVMQIMGIKHCLWVGPARTHQGVRNDHAAIGSETLLTIINPEQLHNYVNVIEEWTTRSAWESQPDENGVPRLVRIKKPVKKVRYEKRATDTYDMVVIDEAHNFSAFPTQALCSRIVKVVAQGLRIILLSGTACPESPAQWYYQITMCTHPLATIWREYATFNQWAKDYIRDRRKLTGAGKFVTDYSQCRTDAIAAAIAPVVVVIKKEDVPQFNEVNEEILTVTPSVEWIRFIRNFARNGVAEITLPNEQKIRLVPESAMGRAQKIHQLCSGTVIFNEKGTICFKDKVLALAQYLVPGRKLAVYYHYVAELDMLRSVFGEKITMDAHEFERSDDKIFVGHVRSSREGINLSTATHIAILTPPWSQTSYSQIKERANVYGREHPSTLVWVVSDFGAKHDSIELRIIEAVHSKKTNMNNVLKLIEDWGNKYVTE